MTPLPTARLSCYFPASSAKACAVFALQNISLYNCITKGFACVGSTCVEKRTSIWSTICTKSSYFQCRAVINLSSNGASHNRNVAEIPRISYRSYGKTMTYHRLMVAMIP